MEDLYVFDINDFNQGLNNEIDTNVYNAELFGATDQEKIQTIKETIKNYISNFLLQVKNIIDKLSCISLANIVLMLINMGVDFDDEEFQYWKNIFELQYLNRLNNIEFYQPHDLEKLLNALQKISPDFNIKKSSSDLDYKERQASKSKSFIQEITENNLKNKQKPNDQDIQLINMLRGIVKIKNNEQKQLEEKIQKQLMEELNKQNQNLFEKKQISLKKQEIISREFSNNKIRKAAMRVAEKTDKPFDEKEVKKLKLKMIAKKGR